MAVAQEPVAQRVIPAFPPWLDLPPGYIVNDWIAWQKGKLVAQHLREHPENLRLALQWLEARMDRLSGHDLEWLGMLRTWPVHDIIALLESPDPEGQRLRSGTPFKGDPFIAPEELEAIRERAYRG